MLSLFIDLSIKFISPICFLSLLMSAFTQGIKLNSRVCFANLI